MSFNIFATATSDIPLANLDANFTMIGSSAVASTLYPTATTSITYGTTGTIHYFSGSGLAVTGTLSAITGATSTIVVGKMSGQNHGAISVNNDLGLTTMVGIAGGASGDANTCYVIAPTSVITRIGASGGITTTSSTGLAVAGALSVTGKITSTATGELFLNNTGSTTGSYFNLHNSSGQLLFGIDNSAGTQLLSSGGIAYSTVLTTATATPIVFGVAQVAVATIASTGLAVTGLISSTGSGTYQIASDGAGDTTLQIGPNAPSATRSGRIGLTTSSNSKNWFIANNWNVGGALEFNQTTTVGGITMSGTPSMILDSSGNLLVGITSGTSYKLSLKTSSASQSAIGTAGTSGDTAFQAIIITKFDNDSTTSQNFIQFQINNGGANCGKITANGANTAAFGSTSDQRVKENIVELPSQLSKIMALRPVEFDYLESYGGGHQIGFIAQEMQQVYPDVISKEDTEEKILSITGWSKTEARLVKAIQEQQAIITALTTRITALEAK